MSRFVTLFKIVLFAPIVLFLWMIISFKKRNLIREDVRIWSEWKHKPLGLYGLMVLYCDYCEFRSLFYFRIGKASYLVSWLVRGQSCLFFRSKSIGGGLLVQHGFSTIIDAERIGKECKIFQQVTIGYKGSQRPIIGDKVVICAGAKVLGNITIGNNVIIGANAVVVKNVPSNSIVGGVPATILKRLKQTIDITE